MLPFKGKNRVTSPFGPRGGATHNGIDLVGGDDATVYAVASGRVVTSTIIAGKNNRTWEWGNYVRVDTPEGETHYYCHLQRRIAAAGQSIAAGDVIGIMGNTGKSFGTHLHFEVRNKFGIAINPAPTLGIQNAIGTSTATGAAPAAPAPATPTPQPPGQTNKEDDTMYRLYQVVSASLSEGQALQEAQSIQSAGGRAGISRASSDGKYRVGTSVFASQNFETVLAELNTTENTFMG